MASFTVPCPKASVSSLTRVRLAATNSSPNASLTFGFQGHVSRQSVVGKVQAKLSKVAAAAKYSNSVAIPTAKPLVDSPEGKDESPKEIVKGNSVPDQQSIIAFMAQVSDLVKLVDSRDIVELQLKQLDCEVLIRKKEALEQPAAPQVQYAAMPPPAMYQSLPLQQAAPAASPAPSSPAPAPASAPASAPAPAPPKAAKSSHPPFKCPMAGTFYRCPGPGEPPFVKVGDKVQKGQVLCIIEAMKLMNEIEADQSGTIVEILMDDAKPVSVDTPLFVIAP